MQRLQFHIQPSNSTMCTLHFIGLLTCKLFGCGGGRSCGDGVDSDGGGGSGSDGGGRGGDCGGGQAEIFISGSFGWKGGLGGSCL